VQEGSDLSSAMTQRVTPTRRSHPFIRSELKK
jgi:hypothetical protein